MILTTPIEVYDGAGKRLATIELEEEHVREWFLNVDRDHAVMALAVCEGICQGRTNEQPKRARCKDAGRGNPL